jgi:MarR family transcriptional regulator, lower aerobic nicotinate degradation pathway regulator
VLARLEGNGLLQRRRSATDSRVKLVHLTAAGRRILARMDGHARRAHERTLDALPPRDRDRFTAFLARLVDAGNAYGRAPMRLDAEE